MILSRKVKLLYPTHHTIVREVSWCMSASLMGPFENERDLTQVLSLINNPSKTYFSRVYKTWNKNDNRQPVKDKSNISLSILSQFLFPEVSS